MTDTATQPLNGEIMLASEPAPNVRRVFHANEPDIELFHNIMVRMGNGEALTAICKEVNNRTYWIIMQWIMRNKELKEEYMDARQIQADYYADSVVDIADHEIDNFK